MNYSSKEYSSSSQDLCREITKTSFAYLHNQILSQKDHFFNQVHFPFLIKVLGETLPYDTIQEVRARLNQVSPNLTRYGLVEEANFFAQAAELASTQKKLALSKDPIDVSQKILTDFYMTDAISRASPTMAKCVQAVKQQLDKGYKKE